jgi:leader peptidase (prepilin peptidase)/N-methyltransferase
MKKPFGMGDILVLLGLSIVVNLELYLGYIYVFLLSSGLYSLYIVLFKKEKIKSSLALLPFMFISLSITFLFYPYIVEFISKVFYF